MAGALPNIGFHISGKELIKGENVGLFDLGACEVARSLQAKLVGSHGFYNRDLDTPDHPPRKTA